MTTDDGRALLSRWMPAVFVLIWATGFIVARYGMPHAPPFTFLLIRYLLSMSASASGSPSPACAGRRPAWNGFTWA